MSKSTLCALVVLIAALILPGSFGSRVNALELVEVSTHFIEVPAGSFGPGTIKLAATLYQPRFLPFAPAAVYIHGWGGRRLMGEDNLAYYISGAGYTVLS